MLRLTRAAVAPWALVALTVALGTAHAQSAEVDAQAREQLELTPASSSSARAGAVLGAGAQAALALGVARLCADPAVSAWLTSTCPRASEGGVTPAELRAAALADLVAWVTRLASHAPLGNARDPGPRRDLWVLSAALQGGSPDAMAAGLRERIDEAARCEAQPDVAQCGAARDHAEQSLARELRALSSNDAPERRALALVAVLEHHATTMVTPAAWASAASAPELHSRTASARLSSLTLSVVRGDLSGLASALGVYVDDEGVGEGVGAPVIEVATLVSLLDARDEAELRKRLLSLAVDVPSWTDGLVLEVDAGLPVLVSGRLALTGSLMLGYHWTDVGFELHGSIAEYEIDQPAVFWDMRRWRGGVSGFHRFTLGDLELEVGIDGDVLLYDSTFVPFDLAPGEFLDENSLMLRGGAAADARYEAGADLVVRVQLGGGLQFESYDRVTNLRGEPEFVRAQDNVDLQTELAATVGWRVWPDVLRLRLRSDTTVFARTVNRAAVADVNDPDVRRSSETLIELDNDTRLSFDLSAAALAGFEPVIYTQANTVQLFGERRNQAAVVFSFGLGISPVVL